MVALLDAHVKVPYPFRNNNNSTLLSIRPNFRRPHRVLSEGTRCGRARASGSATHMLLPGLDLYLIICAFKIYIRRMLQMRRLQLMPRLPRFESPLNNNISILHRPLPHHHHNQLFFSVFYKYESPFNNISILNHHHHHHHLLLL